METCFHCSQVSSCFDLAQHLLAGQGYERTTVDALAAAALMSRRSFFRYFASEEELVLGKFDLVGERLAALLDERPDDEPLWVSLRRMFDPVVGQVADVTGVARTDEMERTVSSTPSLLDRRSPGPPADVSGHRVRRWEYEGAVPPWPPARLELIHGLPRGSHAHPVPVWSRLRTASRLVRRAQGSDRVGSAAVRGRTGRRPTAERGRRPRGVRCWRVRGTSARVFSGADAGPGRSDGKALGV
jgi:AcrR family transcriptional regulator